MENAFQRPDLESYIIDFINKKEESKDVLILSGARQIGKSTILDNLTRDRPRLFLNLERKRSLADQINLCAEFTDFENLLFDEFHFDPAKQILIIDEAQSAPQLSLFVRFMKEQWKFATVVLTGSLIGEMNVPHSRAPVGRETHLEMWPMSFTEFLMAHEKPSLVKTLSQYKPGDAISQSQHERLLELFDLYINVGGLPEVVRYQLNGKNYKKRRHDLLKTYEDDFIRYFSLDQVNLFRRCLNAVAVNVGSPSKDSQAVRVDSPGYKKVAEILARLEQWRLLIKCEQLAIEPEQNKFHPKRYFYDVGMLGDLRLRGTETLHIGNLSHPILRTPLGGIIENSMALSLRRQFGENLFGIRLSHQTEIDFAVKEGSFVFPMECKMSVRFKKNFLPSLSHYLKTYTTHGTGFLFYGGIPLTEAIPGVYILPYYLADQTKRLIASIKTPSSVPKKDRSRRYPVPLI